MANKQLRDLASSVVRETQGQNHGWEPLAATRAAGPPPLADERGDAGALRGGGNGNRCRHCGKLVPKTNMVTQRPHTSEMDTLLHKLHGHSQMWGSNHPRWQDGGRGLVLF